MEFPKNLTNDQLLEHLDSFEPADLFFTDMMPGDTWSEDEEQ